MASSTRTWTDFNAPASDTLFYFVTVKKTDPCYPAGKTRKVGGGPFVQSVSNLEDNRLRSTATLVGKLATEYGFRAYPVPFKEQTTVYYNVWNTAKVLLEVYTVTGQKVAGIVNSRQDRGDYSYTLGQELNPGIYNLRLNIDGKTSTIMIVKLK